MNVRFQSALCAASALICILFFSAPLMGYPLRDFERTGITRLEGYYHSLKTPSGQRIIVPGARLEPNQIKLNLKGRAFPLPAPDPELSRELREAAGGGNVGVALLDISDPDRPRYAAYNAVHAFIPASTGKVLAAFALLQTLADVYPRDIARREKVLRESMITADGIIAEDTTHDVPFWHRDQGTITFRPVQIGDRANLWTYLDWMISASSNAAASTVMKQILLLDHFRAAYPPSPESEDVFFSYNSPERLASLFISIMRRTMQRNGISPEALMQNSFFTKEGKKRVPARGSSASPQEMVRFLMLMEQGRLIDEFSSLELKRLMYMTQLRARYAASPSLVGAAVYYKAGSLYRCAPEPGYWCDKGFGNVLNLMNVVATVESPAKEPRFKYLVSVTSNVLRYDSSELHTQIAGRIQAMMERRYPDRGRRSIPAARPPAGDRRDR